MGTRTSKYIIQDIKGQLFDENGKMFFDGIRMDNSRHEEACRILYSAINEPHVLVDKPHVHDFSHFLCLFGSNPKNLFEFNAEIEIYIDGEKNIITKPSIIYMPAGLPHCPLDFKKIDSPIIFLEIMLTKIYERKPADKKVN
jgi:hypothetical protein